MNKPVAPKGNEGREAIASLGGYVYQIYQSALAWFELGVNEFLFLEVAEDYVIAAKHALSAVQVKRTEGNVTINSDDIIASINSFVELQVNQPQLEVRLRHLTTSHIGKEKSENDRLDDTPTLVTWRTLARTGDLSRLRTILANSKLSAQTKKFIEELDDADFREKFLKRIHFDCGALDFKFLKRQLKAVTTKALQERGGIASQAEECLNNILLLLLNKSTQKEDRFVDRAALEELLEQAVRISVNRAQFDAHNALIAKALASSVPKATDLISSRLAPPRPIDEVPLPSAIAPRSEQIAKIVSSLERDGISWVLGAAGVGKTVAAKLAAGKVAGNWASLNLRNLSSEQVSLILTEIQTAIAEVRDVHGLLIDDFECTPEPYVIESFLNLLSACRRRDLLIIVTAPRTTPSDLLFSANLTANIEEKLEEFREADIEHILSSLGVPDKNWAKYIYLISGSGHPQLAVAAIKSMQQSGWDKNELRTLGSLVDGNSEIEQVRADTRRRLLKDLPEGGRRLLERLSLTTGGFTRSLVLDVAQVAPVVSDGGILFDSLIGSWIDQQEKDRFSLSPLLSNFATNTLRDSEKKQINFEIANSLVKPRTLDPITANSALLAAWSGKNEGVLFKLCFSVIGSDNSELKMIAPHLMMFTHMRTDQPAYDDSPVISQIFRGAQILLLCHEERGSKTFASALRSFQKEGALIQPAKIRAGMELIIYSKLLLSEPIFGPLPGFIEILQELNSLFENQDRNLPTEFLEGIAEFSDITTTIGFMFLNQIRQTKQISDLLSTFKALDACSEDFRVKIFQIYGVSELPVDIDMLISGAWLREHDTETIDSIAHTSAYSQMENLANRWNRKDLAVACRKYQAIILDEYGNDKEAALDVLEGGLKQYGPTNSELIRAKAKVLYRANDHQASLELSSKLIDEGAPLSETEKAFLGREAAISAEKQGNFETARRYYLFGAEAAKDSGVPDMIPMHIGLLADAAIASWHADDRATCLREFIGVLEKLTLLDSKTSVRAAHCHAVSRHVLLWLDQEATGEKRYMADGEAPRIYPGLVSNPEPHPEIGKRFLPVLELSWYMLAQIECHCLLDLGIARNIDTRLPKGPVREGQFLLTRAKLNKALRQLDIRSFNLALTETVAEFAFAVQQGSKENSFNIQNVTYGNFPPPTAEAIKGLRELAGQQILSFVAACILSEDAVAYDAFVAGLMSQSGFTCDERLAACLAGKVAATDYYTSYASLLFANRKTIDDGSLLSPIQVLEFTYKVLQTAKQAGYLQPLSEQMLKWLSERWAFIWERQRFLLQQPLLHEKEIAAAWERNEPNDSVKVLTVLMAILPTLGISNQNEIRRSLEGMLQTVRVA
ncbi:hypothetical protein HFC70_00775 [Agrobacterium sp. a22-2]|uniref:hypothetical protein n=1 Tax=Agrobacterium sp. a22-2 TaxID=2283840 RepID=UPI0014451E67|nr:hypothetical protein [Agrobacterium sp. a22-2]NKN34881.1 hypothetical protein [Agrobacterium sp. a22-2]